MTESRQPYRITVTLSPAERALLDEYHRRKKKIWRRFHGILSAVREAEKEALTVLFQEYLRRAPELTDWLLRPVVEDEASEKGVSDGMDKR